MSYGPLDAFFMSTNFDGHQIDNYQLGYIIQPQFHMKSLEFTPLNKVVEYLKSKIKIQQEVYEEIVHFYFIFQSMVCLFENKCVVDIRTRRFCPACRIKKCYSIGMNRDMILGKFTLNCLFCHCNNGIFMLKFCSKLMSLINV